MRGSRSGRSTGVGHHVAFDLSLWFQSEGRNLSHHDWVGTMRRQAPWIKPCVPRGGCRFRETCLAGPGRAIIDHLEPAEPSCADPTGRSPVAPAAVLRLARTCWRLMPPPPSPRPHPGPALTPAPVLTPALRAELRENAAGITRLRRDRDLARRDRAAIGRELRAVRAGLSPRHRPWRRACRRWSLRWPARAVIPRSACPATAPTHRASPSPARRACSPAAASGRGRSAAPASRGPG